MALSSQIEALSAQIARAAPVRALGRVSGVEAGVLRIAGLGGQARIGDRITVRRTLGGAMPGEVIQLQGETLIALPADALDGIALGDRVSLPGPGTVAPADTWTGRLIDPSGHPLDGRPLLGGAIPRALRADPPAAAGRRPLGARLRTGLAVTDTFLPLVHGQRIGLFAGSGVGKSSLLGHLAREVEADVVVIALIGERGREVRHFMEEVVGVEGLKRTVMITATSDRSPLERRRCAWTGMAVAEHFRDQGLSVLLLADSITRFAEAHREVAVAAGEAPVLRGYPPSTAHQIMSLCERAGPGAEGQGDITAIFSVLVAGSDMDEPVADILRGVLDGHIVLSRDIAERGRYPAIDVLRSVSRSLPAAADDHENALLARARRLLALYDRNEMMIRAGLYTQGSDPELDQAVAIWPELDGFLARVENGDCKDSFRQLELLLRRAGAAPAARARPARNDAA